MRDDSNPSFTNSTGSKHWYDSLGRFHREDGPAFIEPNVSEEWYKHNKRHRLDGPARIVTTDEGVLRLWYVDDKEYDKMDSVFDEAREKYPERFI